MGRALVSAAAAQRDLEVSGLWARDPAGAADGLGLDADRMSADLDPVVAGCDVLIDFSLPGATAAVLEAVLRHGRPLVCGVSGLDADQAAGLSAAAEQIPVVYDRNMSQGIAVLETLVREAARGLGAAFEVEVHETHHVHKVDAPSGTALKLGEALAAVRGIPADSIRYEVERRGEVPGDHTVIFRSETERLELGHSVTTRAVFAEGALRAARWVVGRPAGRYAMRDVLG